MPDGNPAWNNPATQEVWQSLAGKMQPSQGPYSGGFKQGGKAPDNAQWIRQISLIVYKQSEQFGPPASASPVQSGPALARVQRAPGSRADTIELPDVQVTAKADPPASTPASDAKQAAGLELGGLRVTFNVHKNVVGTPNVLEAKVYNLSPQTMKKIIQFTRVQLSAGYKFAQYGMIFDGTVVQYRIGRENITDTYMEIRAVDTDSLAGATSFHRFEVGTKESDIIQQYVKDTGIPAGYLSPTVGTQVLKWPLIVAGPTHKYLRDMMNKYGANCFPDNNKLHVVEQKEILPGEAVILSPQTGLIGIPEATPEGMQIRCLLNPRFKVCGLVQLDKKFISGISYIPGAGVEGTYETQKKQEALAGKGTPQIEVPTPTSPVGRYKIFTIEISGDTRGQPWYDDLVCLAVGEDNMVIESAKVGNTTYKRQVET
jgi:hypothetical protein